MDSTDKADSIIWQHMLWAGAAGLLPLSGAEVTAVTGVQLDMLRQLFKQYDQPFDEAQGKAWIFAFLGNSTSRIASDFAPIFIPGGFFARLGVMSTLSAASTWALGKVFQRYLETGQFISNFDPGAWTSYFNEQYNKAKDFTQSNLSNFNFSWPNFGFSSPTDRAYVVEDAPASKDDDIIRKLSELGRLKAEGIIDEDEFQRTKDRLLNQLGNNQ